MDTNVLYSGVRYSESPESRFRPELDRPRLSEVSACDDVPVIDFLGLKDGSQVVKKIAEANESYGPCQVSSTGVRCPNSPESYSGPESDPRLSEVSACDGVRVIDFMGLEGRSQKKLKSYPDDPSNTVRLSTCNNVNEEKFHLGDDLRLPCHPLDKHVPEPEWSSNPPDSNSRKGKPFYNKGSSEASDEEGAFQIPASDCKSNSDSIREFSQIPNDVDLKNVDNVCSVKEGEMVISSAFFRAGLMLPFHPFIGELLRRLGLAPRQLVPNAWMIVACWLELWKGLGKEPAARLSVDMFLYCYQIRKSPRSSSLWYFFARADDTKLGIKLPSSNGHWKNKYVVVREEALWEGVNCPGGDPKKFDRPTLDVADLKLVKKAVEISRDPNFTSCFSKRMNTKIQSQRKARILGKRKGSSEMQSQESSAHGVIPPVIGPTTSSVDGPPRPSKGKEVAIPPTIDTGDDLETVRSKQVPIVQDVTVDTRSMIRKICHVMEESTKILAKVSEMGNEVKEMLEQLQAAERTED